MSLNKQRILVLDFGSQYTQLIVRRIRELGVYCELHSCDISESEIKAFSPNGIILSGGPETVTETDTPRAPNIVFELGCPVFGICYGMQTMAMQLGGKVLAGSHREFGYAQAKILNDTDLLQGIGDQTDEKNQTYLDVWMSHGDHVEVLPPGFQAVLSTQTTPIAAMSDEKRHFYGVQFHPETTHTRQGTRILERFVIEICGCKPDWNSQCVLDNAMQAVRTMVGEEHVVLGLSGGTDSAVLAALLHKIIGKQLTCIFVDTGLLREGDNHHVMQTLASHMGISVKRIDASQQFLSALKDINDPEAKRKVIGKLFIDIFEEEANKLPNVKWLAQGTIYSDVIESAKTKFKKSHAIKSHHNVGGLPENMQLKLLEPLRELFKDEVRELGLKLGLPYDLVHQHPCPGPGLAVRVLGEVKPEYVELVRKADAIFIEELKSQQLYHTVKQAFAVFLPVKSVGVIGDARQYAPVIALRAIETTDFMTARWAHLPYDFLEKVANRIVNDVHGISRVVYDISGKPPATIEWE